MGTMTKTVTFIKKGSVFLSAKEAEKQWKQDIMTSDQLDDATESDKRILDADTWRETAINNGDLVETIALTENKDGYIASMSMTEEFAASMKKENRKIQQITKDTGWTITRVQKIDGVVTKTW